MDYVHPFPLPPNQHSFPTDPPAPQAFPTDFDSYNLNIDLTNLYTVDTSFTDLLNAGEVDDGLNGGNMEMGEVFQFGSSAQGFGFDWNAPMNENGNLFFPPMEENSEGQAPVRNPSPPSAPIKRKSESSTAAASRPVKPNSRRKACEPCRAKKLRCDGARPHCSTCAKSTLGPSQCLYYADNPRAVTTPPASTDSSESTHKKPRRGGSDVKALEDRINALETMLAAAMSSQRSPSIPSGTESSPSPRQSVTSPSSSEEAWWQMDQRLHQSPETMPQTAPVHVQAKEEMGTPPLDLPTVASAVSKTYLCDVMEKLRSLRLTPPDPFDVDAPLPPDVLPDLHREIIRKDLLDIYFSRPASFIPFNFLHRETFMRNINDESPMLLFALYAAACRVSEDPRTRNSYRFFYQRARNLVSMHVECPTLSGLQGMLFLTLASIVQGLFSTAWMYQAMACRMAQFLRLDVDPVDLGIQNWAEIEIRRRTWFCVAIMDRMRSCVDNKVPFFHGGYLGKVQPPGPEAMWENANEEGEMPDGLKGMEYPAYGEWAAKFCEFYAQAVEYNRTALRTGVDFNTIDPTLTLLEAEIDHHYSTAHPTIHSVATRNNFVISTTSLDPPPYHAVVCYMLHKAALCLIYRPRMIAAFSTRTKHPSATKAIMEAQNAANELSRLAHHLITTTVKTSDDTWVAIDVSPFPCSMGIFEAGMVQIMSSALAVSRNEMPSIERSQQNFSALKQLLESMARRLPPARLMSDLMGVVNRRVLRALGWKGNVGNEVEGEGEGKWVEEVCDGVKKGGVSEEVLVLVRRRVMEVCLE